jgi:catechol 2,3-dioxygenase-like lactoylglutathione lyase family enzyme
MNHFTVLTRDLERTVAFYAKFLGLQAGARPPFDFPGAWLYAGGQPILHIVAGGLPMPAEPAGVLDHMAFSGRDLRATLALLQGDGMPYELVRLPGDGTWQLFFHDPNGARVEIDFDRGEPGP